MEGCSTRSVEFGDVVCGVVRNRTADNTADGYWIGDWNWYGECNCSNQVLDRTGSYPFLSKLRSEWETGRRGNGQKGINKRSLVTSHVF
jgi:hypothetical protein